MSRQFYCMGRKPRGLRKPSSRRYKYLLTVVYAKYVGSVGRTLSNNLLWERTNQVPAEEEIRKKRRKWKALNCVTSQTFTWNPQGQKKRGRPKNTLHREMETEMGRMNKNWMELERNAQERVSRLVNGGRWPMLHWE
ncbi:unnamed protein product [Schistosoma margrebowiei]|uniref:Uncharacterized protein n=1 Tax=Schistosoma margrebowiei TaxID=48269 RepID=A0A183LMD7_9TREM|nr:unnamed protein product [Schistosoma margrebowiei]